MESVNTGVLIELRFPVIGNSLPSDHGYMLFSAISHLIAEAHLGDWLSVETIAGMKKGDGTIVLNERPLLKMRLPQDYISSLLKLAGKSLEIKNHKIRLGIPQIFPLKPSSILYARCVTIKNHTQPESFLEAVKQKLKDLEILAEIEIGPRRAFRVSSHRIVGFGLVLHQLNDNASILLQQCGLGGRRHMGCGIFNPTNNNFSDQGKYE